MCSICERSPCLSQCPNYKCRKIGCCKNCGIVLYDNDNIWTDNDENKFCSKECVEDYYGIKEMDF